MAAVTIPCNSQPRNGEFLHFETRLSVLTTHVACGSMMTMSAEAPALIVPADR